MIVLLLALSARAEDPVIAVPSAPDAPLPPPPAAASTPPVAPTYVHGDLCSATLSQHVFAAAPTGINPCEHLAYVVFDELVKRGAGRLTVTDAMLEPEASAVAGAGTIAATEAVPSVVPTPSAATAIGYAGTGAESKIVASLSFNPFGASTTREAHAKGARLGDVTLSVPIDPTGGGVSAYDLRARLNVTGIHAGDAAYDAAIAKLNTLSTDSGLLLDQLNQAFAHGDPAACTAAVLGEEGAVERACAGEVLALDAFGVSDADARAALGTAREAADARYAGVDVRVSGEAPTATGESWSRTMLVAAAGGRSGSQQPASWGVRWRLGVAQTVAHDASSATSIDVGAAASWSSTQDATTTLVTAGIEGRLRFQGVDVEDASVLDAVVGLQVPTSEGDRAGIAVTLPISLEGIGGPTRDLTPTIALTGNWAKVR